MLQIDNKKISIILISITILLCILIFYTVSQLQSTQKLLQNSIQKIDRTEEQLAEVRKQRDDLLYPSPTPLFNTSTWQAQTGTQWNIDYRCPTEWICDQTDNRIVLTNKKLKNRYISFYIYNLTRSNFKHPSFSSAGNWYYALSRKDINAVTDENGKNSYPGSDNPNPFYFQYDVKNINPVVIGNILSTSVQTSSGVDYLIPIGDMMVRRAVIYRISVGPKESYADPVILPFLSTFNFPL